MTGSKLYLSEVERKQLLELKHLYDEEYDRKGSWTVGPDGKSGHERWVSAAMNAAPRLCVQLEEAREVFRTLRRDIPLDLETAATIRRLGKVLGMP